MLVRFAETIAASRLRQHLLFLTVTIVTVYFAGYHFGTFDQTIHIPFLKKFVDPSLYPNNPFLELRNQHYSYFWFLFQPFYRAGILEIALFVGHLIATYATFWGLWLLSFTLFRSPLAALLTVVTFIWPHMGFAGFPVFEFSLLNRTAVLPGLIFAVILFLNRRYILAYGLLGFLYNFHVISVQFVLAMFLLASFIEFRRLGWRNLAGGLALFLVMALPILIWRLGSAPLDFMPRPEWFDLISRGMLYNVFFLFPPYLHIILISISGLSVLWLFDIARKNRHPLTPMDRTVGIFVAAATIIIMVQIITAQRLPLTFIIQSQIIRAGMFVLIFGLVYFAWYVAHLIEQQKQKKRDLAALTIALVFSLMPLVPLMVVGYQTWLKPGFWQRVLTWSTLNGFFTATLLIAVVYGLWSPGIHMYGPETDWEDAQVWAKENTAVDAVFITPPHIWGLYQSDWQVFSERSTVATLSELLEAAFFPHYIDYWRPRFEALAPGAVDQFRGDYFENQLITKSAFYTLDTADFLRLGNEFVAGYLVVERPAEHELPLLYENEGYRIYKLCGADC